MNPCQQINQSSGKVSFGSPSELVEAARRVMGRIDLDPASSAEFNKVVKAAWHFTKSDDGIEQKWYGNIWLNWPFGRREKPCKPDCQKHLKNPKHVHHSYLIHGNKAWVEKLLSEYAIGNVSQACAICFGSTSESWFQLLAAYPQCLISGRTNYLTEEGEPTDNVPKGSVVTYLGPAVARFAAEFRKFGAIKVPYQF